MANDNQFVLKLRFTVDLMEAEDDENKDALEQNFAMRFLNVTELLASTDVAIELWAEVMGNLTEVSRKEGLFLDNDASDTSPLQYVAKLGYSVYNQNDETGPAGLEQDFAMRFLNDTEILAVDVVCQQAWSNAMQKLKVLAAEQGLFLDAD